MSPKVQTDEPVNRGPHREVRARYLQESDMCSFARSSKCETSTCSNACLYSGRTTTERDECIEIMGKSAGIRHPNY